MALKIRSIWDNEGESIDQFTVVTNYQDSGPGGEKSFNGHPVFMGLSISHNCNSPQGVSIFGSCVEGDHLGKKIELKDLSIELQEHIHKRLK